MLNLNLLSEICGNKYNLFLHYNKPLMFHNRIGSEYVFLVVLKLIEYSITKNILWSN